ncbi:MAG TPA: SET domain-containing protein-lysine N-methyltransferase [Candidatus Paceibacterota bacterium]|nr:SET domain-containing protein-lysine N-methyltransferase [Candidatus Paceibacterota bacterium]
MLDINIEVRTMKTGRRAVFALDDFMPGDIIFAWDASNTFTDEAYARLSPEQKAFVAPFEDKWTFMTEPMCYVQHSSNGNAGSRRGTVIAIKEIHAGEEITIDFRHPNA